jgi:sarcosine oxidase gamma subunit
VVELVAEAGDYLGLPLEAGGARLAALPAAPILSIAPFRGREPEVAAALGAALQVGRAVAVGQGRLIWAGLGVWFLHGTRGKTPLDGIAAVTEQGDGWTGLLLTGADAGAVLARLVPLDLAALQPGSAARTMLRHVPLLLVKGQAGVELFVPRSYAATAIGEIGHAMRGVAARAGLDSRPVTPAGA